jgi:hypothetical protein
MRANVTEVAPDVTVVEAGIARAALLLLKLTAKPPAGAALVSDTVQVEEPPKVRLAGAQLTDCRAAGATRLSEKVREPQLEQVRRWIENYHQVKLHLEKISEINRELLRRQKDQSRRRKSAAK